MAFLGDDVRIAILNTQVPFVFGGAEIHANNLKNAIIEHGHEAEIVSLPFKWYPVDSLLDSIAAARMLDVSESNGTPIDRAIGLKFPAYLMPHPNKVMWILHQYRTAYDLWNDPKFGDLRQSEKGGIAREIIRRVDKVYIPQAKAVFANSRNVANRLKEFTDIDATPLYHPPEDADRFYCEPVEKYLFMPSRISELKRHDLVIQALSLCRQPVEVRFAGAPDEQKTLINLQQLAEKLGVAQQVKWLGRISQQEKLDAYAKCLGVVYVPLDEDYGYVTLEAMLASKPVITARDSGGPMEFVSNENTGYVCQPTPESLAEAMDTLWANPSRAKDMGMAGLEAYHALGIGWANVVEKLLG